LSLLCTIATQPARLTRAPACPITVFLPSSLSLSRRRSSTAHLRSLTAPARSTLSPPLPSPVHCPRPRPCPVAARPRRSPLAYGARPLVRCTRLPTSVPTSRARPLARSLSLSLLRTIATQPARLTRSPACPITAPCSHTTPRVGSLTSALPPRARPLARLLALSPLRTIANQPARLTRSPACPITVPLPLSLS
jgi:hypothetical protein